MLDDWRDGQLMRLERDLTELRRKMWSLEADVRRQFWERDQRGLRALSWVALVLPWIAVGVAIAAALIKAQ
jgi:hypothetical protein